MEFSKPGTYWIYNIATRKLLDSRDVTFDESFAFVRRDREKHSWTFIMDEPGNKPLFYEPTAQIEAEFDEFEAAAGRRVGGNAPPIGFKPK